MTKSIYLLTIGILVGIVMIILGITLEYTIISLIGLAISIFYILPIFKMCKDVTTLK